MKEDFITTHTYTLAKEKGFKPFNNGCNECTHSMLLKWLRSEKSIHVYTIPSVSKSYQITEWRYKIIKFDIDTWKSMKVKTLYWEKENQCLEAGLQEALKMI